MEQPKRKIFDKSHEICRVCYKIKTILKPKQSGNKVIDDFIKYTQSDYAIIEGDKMEFIPYDQFINIEFIAEGGFSKIYKATWIDGPIKKLLTNSKNIISKELNELKVFYQIYSDKKASNSNISEYFGITQDPITKDIMIIIPYYNNGDLTNYISNDFYNVKIIHRDLHSGNIFFNNYNACIGDLGISKSATECTNNSNENYGITPYMAPEIFQGQKYTEASDIYSYGMIMWEFITSRRPFWNEIHDIELIIKICDGLRPPTVTNASKGYVKLVMKECWHSDPDKRPKAIDLEHKLRNILSNEQNNTFNGNPTKIIKSSDIGPVTINNLGAIYKNKRKFEEDLIEDSNVNDQSIKRRKLFESEHCDYFIKETELGTNKDFYINNEYVTKEFDIDINNLI
ncbi:kinase-like domain-containing protein [Rhizophagus diaphanus]|nr:kinase-like domain-containing protein [Rhizophagus diaphanus] [Rhizophagus sp. MUCL 43196]